jgi:membrane protease YdiL (CAAX protease family)
MANLAVSEQDAIAKRRVVRELSAYFALAFGITFGLGAAVIFFRPQFESIFGPLGPLNTSWPYYVGVCAPTISAVLLSAVFGGLKSVKNLFAGLFRPFQFRWVFVALLTFPMGLLIWGLIERMMFGNHVPHNIDIHAILTTAPLLLFTSAAIFVDPGPWGEETGWRGFALPRLLTLLSPLQAAMVLGVIWAVWHTPAFLVSGLSQSDYSFGWFLVGVTCMSILMAWIYVNANCNFFVAGFIPHEINNRFFGFAVTDVKIQALVMIAIVAMIFVISGPGLKGWRFARTTPAEV